MKTRSSLSSSSARASFKASRTATSFTPLGLAYVLCSFLLATRGINGTEREAIEDGNELESNLDAGRRSRLADIAGLQLNEQQ